MKKLILISAVLFFGCITNPKQDDSEFIVLRYASICKDSMFTYTYNPGYVPSRWDIYLITTNQDSSSSKISYPTPWNSSKDNTGFTFSCRPDYIEYDITLWR